MERRGEPSAALLLVRLVGREGGGPKWLLLVLLLVGRGGRAAREASGGKALLRLLRLLQRLLLRLVVGVLHEPRAAPVPVHPPVHAAVGGLLRLVGRVAGRGHRHPPWHAHPRRPRPWGTWAAAPSGPASGSRR